MTDETNTTAKLDAPKFLPRIFSEYIGNDCVDIRTGKHYISHELLPLYHKEEYLSLEEHKAILAELSGRCQVSEENNIEYVKRIAELEEHEHKMAAVRDKLEKIIRIIDPMENYLYIDGSPLEPEIKAIKAILDEVLAMGNKL